MTLTIYHYLALATALFAIGVFGFLTRKNVIGMLMSLELVFNAVNINMVAFSKYLPQNALLGQIFTLFIIAVAAAESVLGLAIILALYRKRVTVDPDDMNLMKN
jgi:NAD(P)H-quinone oxidoreductase subunit 4L